MEEKKKFSIGKVVMWVIFARFRSSSDISVDLAGRFLPCKQQ